MACSGNLVSLKLQWSHMDIPSYLVGYIITEDNKVTVYTREITDLLPALSKKGRSTW